MGYPTGFDSDLDPMSSDEKSDGEGKSETSSHTSNNPTHSSDSSNTLEVWIEKCACDIYIKAYTSSNAFIKFWVFLFLNSDNVTVSL